MRITSSMNKNTAVKMCSDNQEATSRCVDKCNARLCCLSAGGSLRSTDGKLRNNSCCQATPEAHSLYEDLQVCLRNTGWDVLC